MYKIAMNKLKYFFYRFFLLLMGCLCVSAQAGYTETRYPIVLVHGLMGFDSIGGLVDYWHNIEWNLQRSGAKVYIAQVAALGDSEYRGIQLKDFIQNNIPEAKVNLFGHSQGAPTIRVAASLLPQRVASLTSISGVNKGSKVADIIRDVLPPGSDTEGGAAALVEAIGALIGLLSGDDSPQNAVGALDTLTTLGTADLNSRHGWGIDTGNDCGTTSEDVDIFGNSVKVFSWVGTRPITNLLDPGDYFLEITSQAFGSESNDGLVAQCAQYMGKVVYETPYMNHIDPMNHFLGINSPWLEPIALYRQHANRLKKLGL